MTPGNISEDEVMRGFPVPARARITPATVYRPPFTRWFMQHVREVERTAVAGRSPSGSPPPPPTPWWCCTAERSSTSATSAA
jgi:hypothetical protein